MKRRGIGIMSGTSLDGIDVVMADIEGNFTGTSMEILCSTTVPFEKNLEKRLRSMIEKKTAALNEICSINVELGEAFAAACVRLCEIAGIALDSVDFVASHGQTLYHIGDEKEGVPSTLQIGESAVIANRLKKTVVANFRAADVAQGGQGAPLVPYADFVLFAHEGRDIALHNLGGISNLTVVPGSNRLDDVLAFDTGPANMMIDQAMGMLYGKPYDNDGAHAAKGMMIDTLMGALMHHPYLLQKPPKSTGRELFGDDATRRIITPYLENHYPDDIIRTLTMFTACSIRDAYEQYVFPYYDIKEILFSGGGASNRFLMETLKTMMPSVRVKTFDKNGIDKDNKEAAAFIILANETLSGLPSNVTRATGAKQAVILGTIHHYFDEKETL